MLISMAEDYFRQRQQLVTQLHQQDGIRDRRVLDALLAVPRELFVESSFSEVAYANRALPLVLGQTISQPLMVAVMTEALHLDGNERILEIGTGSGYQTAILSLLVSHVYTVERHPQLSDQAARRLQQLGYRNVSYFVGDGSVGWPEQAPYERILVTAAAPHVPGQLVAQLAMGGLLVVPVGDKTQQELLVIQRTPEGTHTQSLGRCVFVPLIGSDGWQ